jgi:hypothetical protein
LIDQTHATLRGELLDLSGAKEGSRADVEQYGNLFRAEIFVPVWTSLLYVNDWLQPGSLPIAASISNQGQNAEVIIENLLDRPLTDARVVAGGSVYELGTLPPQEKKTFKLDPSKAMQLHAFVQQHGASFQRAVEQRRNPLGDDKEGWLKNPSLNAMVASFPSHLPMPHPQRSFVSPAGLDLSPLAERGDAILLAWDADHSFVNSMNNFKPPRSQRNTLLRMVISPAPQPKA